MMSGTTALPGRVVRTGLARVHPARPASRRLLLLLFAAHAGVAGSTGGTRSVSAGWKVLATTLNAGSDGRSSRTAGATTVMELTI
jgi:hypothetical protein